MLKELSIETWGAEDRVIAPNEVYLCRDLITAGIYTRAPEGSDAPFQQQPIGWTWRRWWYPTHEDARDELGRFKFFRAFADEGTNAAGVEGWWTPWFLFRDPDGLSAPSDLAQAVDGPWELFTGKIIPRAPWVPVVANAPAPDEQPDPAAEEDAKTYPATAPWDERRDARLVWTGGKPVPGDAVMRVSPEGYWLPEPIAEVRATLQDDVWWVRPSGHGYWIKATRDMVVVARDG